MAIITHKHTHTQSEASGEQRPIELFVDVCVCLGSIGRMAGLDERTEETGGDMRWISRWKCLAAKALSSSGRERKS